MPETALCGGGFCRRACRVLLFGIIYVDAQRCVLSHPNRMYRRTSNLVGISYPPSVISVLKVWKRALQNQAQADLEKTPFAHSTTTWLEISRIHVVAEIYGQKSTTPFFFPSPTQNVDKWSFDVFALNEASGEHALKFIFYELLTRYDLISRFKVKIQYNLFVSIFKKKERKKRRPKKWNNIFF